MGQGVSHARHHGGLSVSRRAAVAALFLVAVYLLTRLLFIARFPYFFDEGTYASFINQAAHSTSRLFVSLTIGREPLQIWLGIPWVKLGFNPVVAGRLVSMTAGLLTVAVIGRLGREAGGASVGWVAAGLAVLLPFLVVNDGIGIYEPLVTLIMSAALLLQVELARRPGLGRGALLGFVLGAGILTKRNAEPALFLMPFSLLCFDWSVSDRSERLKKWGGALALAVFGVVVASLVLRSSSYWTQYQRFNGTTARGIGFAGVRPLRLVLRDPFAFSGQAWSAFRPALLGYVTIPLMAVAVLGLIVAWRSRPRMAALLLVWIVVPFLGALTFSTLSFPRHVMFIMPPLIVVVAYGLVEAGQWVGRILSRRMAVVVLTLGAALALGEALAFDARVIAHPRTARYPGLDDQQYVTGTQSGASWDAVAAMIRKRGTGNPVVVVLANGYRDVIQWITWPDRRYRFVTDDLFTPDGSSPFSHAQFAIVDELKFFPNGRALELARAKRLHFKLVGRFPRPRRGAVIELYERPPVS
jgi:4-amino-4-deoxy-L-arabinose transferase-like glycosyltransferase